MGTKNNPSAYDCYANAHPDEPMFVLLARDKHAPTLVWLWALLRELEQEDAAKVAEARDCVEDMLQWQLAHGRKTIGIGHAALAGVMGLVRAANAGIKAAPNAATRDEELQRILSLTLFDDPMHVDESSNLQGKPVDETGETHTPADGGVLEGTNRTTSGAIGQP